MSGRVLPNIRNSQHLYPILNPETTLRKATNKNTVTALRIITDRYPEVSTLRKLMAADPELRFKTLSKMSIDEVQRYRDYVVDRSNAKNGVSRAKEKNERLKEAVNRLRTAETDGDASSAKAASVSVEAAISEMSSNFDWITNYIKQHDVNDDILRDLNLQELREQMTKEIVDPRKNPGLAVSVGIAGPIKDLLDLKNQNEQLEISRRQLELAEKADARAQAEHDAEVKKKIDDLSSRIDALNESLDESAKILNSIRSADNSPPAGARGGK
jgi:hypothetical protein